MQRNGTRYNTQCVAELSCDTHMAASVKLVTRWNLTSVVPDVEEVCEQWLEQMNVSGVRFQNTAESMLQSTTVQISRL